MKHNIYIGYMSNIKDWFFARLVFCLFTGCGETNLADCDGMFVKITGQCVSRTGDEIAYDALKNKQFNQAVTHYRELIKKEPNNYQRYPLLSAAYAGLANVDIFDILFSIDFDNKDSEENFDAFLPSPKTLGEQRFMQGLEYMKSAIDILKQMPEEHRTQTKNYPYAQGASIQLGIYQLAYAMMLMKKFIVQKDNKLDQHTLNSMTNDEAEEILKILRNLSPTAGGYPVPKADKILEDIQKEEGSSREKLTAYLKKTNG